MPVTLKDISKIAGVSEATVSLALNNKSVVNEKTQKRIKEIADRLNYSPNAIAISLSKQKSNTIGLVVPDIENPYYGKLVRCIDEYLRKLNYNLIIAISNESLPNEQSIIENFISERVEGILIAPVSRPVSEIYYTEKLKMYNIKYLFITSYYTNLAEPFVMSNLETGSYDLVEYLISNGHKEIYFLVGNKETIPTKMRIKGYIEAYKNHNMEVNNDFFITCSLPNFEQAYLEMNTLLKRKKKMDAVIAINDIMALGAYRALRENNIKIPKDVSLAGYDNVIYSGISTIPITTVDQNIEKMSSVSADTIIQMIADDKKITDSMLLKPKLIVRDSTGPASS